MSPRQANEPLNLEPDRVLIFGNSGAGKSTLAKSLSNAHQLAHLDLDTLAWEPTEPPQRRSILDSQTHIQTFIDRHKRWVIEGCYSDLLSLSVPFASRMIFLDLPVEACRSNAKNRPWEPHKYPSKEAQDANLDMLLRWISDYEERTDDFSRTAHQTLFRRFTGKKQRITENLKVA